MTLLAAYKEMLAKNHCDEDPKAASEKAKEILAEIGLNAGQLSDVLAYAQFQN